jgi:hypothetical protein
MKIVGVFGLVALLSLSLPALADQSNTAKQRHELERELRDMGKAVILNTGAILLNSLAQAIDGSYDDGAPDYGDREDPDGYYRATNGASPRLRAASAPPQVLEAPSQADPNRRL